MLGKTGELTQLRAKAEEAVLDGALWPNFCDALTQTISGGLGTVFLPVDPKERGSWMVHSESLSDALKIYIDEGWHKRDYRQGGIKTAIRRGFVTDLDFIDAGAMARHPYYADFQRRVGLGQFLGIHVDIGGRDWIAAVQRSPKSGSPDSDTLSAMPQIRAIVQGALRSSHMLESARFASVKQFLELSGQGIVAIGHNERAVILNEAAERLLGPYWSSAKGLPVLPPPAPAQQVEDFIARARAASAGALMPPPIIFEVAPGTAMVIEAMPFPNLLRHFHVDCVALLLVRLAATATRDLGARVGGRYGLTASELRVALGVYAGRSLKEIAESRGLSEGTVRQQIKAVFRKTGTHNQTQLVLLLAGC